MATKAGQQKGAHAPLLTPEVLDDALGGPTYFRKFYCFRRRWMLAFVFSAFGTPLMRLHDEYEEEFEPSHYNDVMLWSDTTLCGISLLLMLSITWAVDTPAFVKMHSRKGRPLHPYWARSIKILAMVNIFRPLVPWAMRNSRFAVYSHTGGIFEASAAVVALAFGIGVYDMTMRAAGDVLWEIQESRDKGKWVRVMQLVQGLRADMFCLWSPGSVGLPWLVFIAGALYGAYSNGMLFLQTRLPQRALFFFMYLTGILAVLYPLSLVTTACSKSLTRAATKWYPTRDAEEMVALHEHEFQSYTLVLRYLDRNFIGVNVLGFSITSSLLRDLALKVFLGLPGLYSAVVALMGSHAHGSGRG